MLPKTKTLSGAGKYLTCGIRSLHFRSVPQIPNAAAVLANYCLREAFFL
jgi:hypothetical protein